MKRLALSLFALLTLIPAAATQGQDTSAFRRRVHPFVQVYCVDCHGPDIQQAGLRLDTLGTDLAHEVNFARWVRVHDKLARGEMPEFILPLDRMPLTASGKIVKRELMRAVAEGNLTPLPVRFTGPPPIKD